MSEYPDPLKNACPTYGMQDPFAALLRPAAPWNYQLQCIPPIHQLKVQLLHPDAKLPTRGSEHAAGLDLYAASVTRYGLSMLEVDTGVAVAIPEGYTGLVLPRSSITATSMRLGNSCGVVDPDYRGSIKLRFDDLELDDSERNYEVGDRVGQLLIVPAPRFEPVQVDQLPETARGTGGYGSSGR